MADYNLVKDKAWNSNISFFMIYHFASKWCKVCKWGRAFFIGNVKVHVETFQQVFEKTFGYEKRYSGYNTFLQIQYFYWMEALIVRYILLKSLSLSVHFILTPPKNLRNSRDKEMSTLANQQMVDICTQKSKS